MPPLLLKKKNSHVGEDEEQTEPSHTDTMGIENGAAAVENSSVVPQ